MQENEEILKESRVRVLGLAERLLEICWEGRSRHEGIAALETARAVFESQCETFSLCRERQILSESAGSACSQPFSQVAQPLPVSSSVSSDQTGE
jgi:hypothetical protein